MVFMSNGSPEHVAHVWMETDIVNIYSIVNPSCSLSNGCNPFLISPKTHQHNSIQNILISFWVFILI